MKQNIPVPVFFAIENDPNLKAKFPQQAGQEIGRIEGGLRSKGIFKRSMEKKPLITVITVVFNGAETLRDTIESVIRQSYDSI